MELGNSQKLLLFILQNRLSCSITELMKLCYIVELAFKKKFQKRITTYSYIRYNYGPFESKIYGDINSLMLCNMLKANMFQTPYGEELWKYSINDGDTSLTEGLFASEEEKTHCLDLLSELASFNAIDLTKLSYETSPMKALNATLGGNENLGAVLAF